MDIWLENSIEPFAKFENGHSNSVECLQFNPCNANELATGSHDKLIKIWDVAKFKEVNKLSGHKEGIWSLTYSVDGKQIFSGSPDKSIMVWDVRSAKAVSALKEHKNKIYWVQSSDNGMYLASGGQDGHIILWDMRKLKMAKDIQASMDIVYNINFAPQSKYFFSGDSMGIVKAYDSQRLDEISASKPKIQQQKKEKIYAIQSIEWEKQYKLLVAQKNKCVSQFTFDPKYQTLKKDFEYQVHFEGVHCLAVDKTKERFATGCRDGSARVWKLEKNTNKEFKAIVNLLGHKQRVSGIEFHSTNKMVATCSWDQNIHFYKI